MSKGCCFEGLVLNESKEVFEKEEVRVVEEGCGRRN
jgi:hypothetical protein